MGVTQTTLRLLRLALSLDIGTVTASTTDVVLYCLRTCVRIENAVAFLVAHGTAGPGAFSASLPEPPSAHCLGVLRGFTDAMRALLEQRVEPLLQKWLQELLRDTAPDAEAIKSACNVQAHVLMLYRNVPPHTLAPYGMGAILRAMLFLNMRHTWNQNYLQVLHRPMLRAAETSRGVGKGGTVDRSHHSISSGASVVSAKGACDNVTEELYVLTVLLCSLLPWCEG